MTLDTSARLNSKEWPHHRQPTAKDIKDLKRIIAAVLHKIDLYSRDAEALMMGTAATESAFVLRQQSNGGPARGLFQMEKTTFDFLVSDLHRDRHRQIRGRIFSMVHGRPNFESMTFNDHFAAAMARFKYYTIPAPIPTNASGQSFYWRWRYNGDSRKGRTAADYMHCWRLYCSHFYPSIPEGVFIVADHTEFDKDYNNSNYI